VISRNVRDKLEQKGKFVTHRPNASASNS